MGEFDKIKMPKFVDDYLDNVATAKQINEMIEWLRVSEKNLIDFTRYAYFDSLIESAMINEEQEAGIARSIFWADDSKTHHINDLFKAVVADCIDSSDSEKLIDLSEKLRVKNRERLSGLRGRDQRKSSVDKVKEHYAFVIPRIGVWAAVVGFVAIGLLAIMFNNNVQIPHDKSLAAGGQVESLEMCSIAKVLRTHDVIWAELSEQLRGGSAVVKDKSYTLRSGLVELEMSETGAVVLFEGPCQFKVIHENAVRLVRGRVTAEVKTELAKGFYVDTPQGRIIDLGTEFGVSVNHLGGTRAIVFDGEIILKDQVMVNNASEGVRLVAGEYLDVSREGYIDDRVEEITLYDSIRFTRIKKLDQIKRAENGSAYDRWALNCEEISRRDDLVCYFNGGLQEQQGSVLINRAVGTAGKRHSGIVGKIVNANWSPGRWGNDSALAINNGTEYVSLDITEDFRSVTMMAWVNLNKNTKSLYRVFLDNQRYSEPGDLHWQLSEKMEFQSSVIVSGLGSGSAVSTPVIKLVQYNHWHLMSVVFDSGSQSVSYYIDGIFFESLPVEMAHPIHLGASRIGGWDVRGRGNYQGRGFSPLNGRIDSLMIFDRALDGDDILDIFNKTSKRK